MNLEYRTLVDLLRVRADSQPHQIAYTFLLDGEVEDSRLTYGELDQRARAIAARLQSLGAKGELALLLYPPGLDYIAAFFGCLYAGAVAVPVYPPTSQRSLPRLWSIVKDAGPRVALTTTLTLSKLEQTSGAPALKALQWLTTDDVDVDLASQWRNEPLRSETLAFVQYTSGSTATPKGVMLTHDNLLHNQRMIKTAFEQSEESIILGWLPLYHDMGLIGNVFQSMYCGAPCILMSPLSFLQRPARWLQAISRYRATTSGGPNFAYDLCVRKIGLEERANLDLRSWTVAFNGAEPIRQGTIDRFCAAFEPCGFTREAFFPCYGLAEATLFVSGGLKSAPPVIANVKRSGLEMNEAVAAGSDDNDVVSLVGSGGSWLDQEILIVDPVSLRECAPGNVGEILVSGPHVAQGYWRRPDETESTFKVYVNGAGPFLRTGDLGFVQAGELFVTGRRKDLIIIRGRNYFPQDIELTAESSHASVRPGGGAAFSVDAAGEERLVVVHEVERQREIDFTEVIGAIRQAVSAEYELQVYAVVLLKPGSLPKTSSGKIQRHRCRASFLKDEFETLATWRANLEAASVDENSDSLVAAIRSAPDEKLIEEWLVDALATRLRLSPSEIERDRPVVYYGVDSLIAVDVTHSLETSLGVTLSAGDLLQSSSMTELARQVCKALSARTPEAEALAPVRAMQHEAPLSYGQRALWFLHQVAPEGAAYNIATAARVHSALDAPALEQALQQLVERHPALRTTFPVELETPVQRVADLATISFQQEETAHLDETAFAQYLREETGRPFDLTAGPLLRTKLFQRRPNEYVLLFVAHHMVADFWSMALLINELGILYQAQTAGLSARLTPLSTTYVDYSSWQENLLAEAKGEQLWHYWEKQLSGAQTILSLPSSRPRPPVQTHAGANERFRIDKELTEKLKRLSQHYNSTLYITLLAAFQILLYRYTGQEDFLVGSPTSGRRESAFRSVVGYFVNPVVLRARIAPEMTFESLHGEVRQTVLEAMEHEEFPFGLLVERLQIERDPSRAPLFQIMFSWQQSPSPQQPELPAFALGESGKRLQIGGLELEPMPLDQPVAQFDLTLMMAEVGGELTGVLQYNTDLFDATAIARFAEHFQVLLADIVNDSQARVVDLPLLTPSDSQLLLKDLNDTASEYDEELCLHTLFEAQVKRTPDQTALIFRDQQYTYSELNRRANQLAYHLKTLGVGPEVCVGICLERSLEMVVGLLGILKAGGAYLPLDPAYPKDRLAYMLADSEVRVLLTQGDLAVDLNTDVRRVCLDRWTDFAGERGENPLSDSKAQNLAYVIYTSGSTGRPKGVMISHRNVANFCAGIDQCFAAHEAGTWLAVTSISFDISVLELLWTLIRGFKVVIHSDAETDAEGDQSLAAQLQQHGVTHLQCTPSLARLLLLDSATRGALTNLRHLLLGGEAVSSELVAELQTLTRAQVRNMYGPTETTIWSTTYTGDCGPQTMPIGKPLANTSVYVLDKQMAPVPFGVTGELYIGGDGVSRGYRKRADLTAERFVPDPWHSQGARMYRTGDLVRYRPDHALEFLGRDDHQIKLRGHRIEFGEIEMQLRQHPAIRAAVVAIKDLAPGDANLVAYLVPHQPAEITSDSQIFVAEIRNFLRSSLPAHFIPSVFMILDELPLTPNGKIDRKSLPLPGPQDAQPAANVVAPRTSTESELAALWSEILGSDRFGIHDNFFDSGGHSLTATQLVTRIRKNFGVELSLRDFIKSPTIAGLAELVEESILAKASDEKLFALVEVLESQKPA